jgi:hypothetical protein
VRGLTPVERGLLQSIVGATPDVPHTSSNLYAPNDAAALELLRAQGRIIVVRCRHCGAQHPAVTAAGLEALRLSLAS